MAKKTFNGIIVSDKMKNTVVIEIVRKVRHPMYGKVIKKTKRLKADANGMTISVGDMVKIEETKPISRDKYFKVIKKV